jgi:hypothetical protein
MRVRLWTPSALLVVLSGLAGCSGGDAKVGSASADCASGDNSLLCLTNCNLGCSSTGCLRTNIAQNEVLIFQFNKDLDPRSVTPSTIRLRTASGDQPVGDFFVNGDQVEFVPALRNSGGQTFFGFTPGETYSLSIPGIESGVTLESTSGNRFGKTFTCSLISNLGIVDQNAVPPSARLVSPTELQLGAAPRDVLIQLEFNELIDSTPFAGGSATSPVSFNVRRTRPAGSGRECDANSLPQPLVGTQRLTFTRDKSILTFLPAQPLPANVCIAISVTPGVIDLAGVPARPQQFQFLTEQVPLVEESIVENFELGTFRDEDASAATWAGGFATFTRIGGDGRHGPFQLDPAWFQGNSGGKRNFTINCSNTIIPAENTRTGAPIAISDGNFFFESFVVPADVRLKFVGGINNAPARITVSGRIDIQGEIDIAGQSLTYPPVPYTSTVTLGQAGGLGGAGGGAGGKGGDRCLGIGSSPLFDGAHGEAVRVPVGQNYLNPPALTRGAGSTMFPANGISQPPNSLLVFGPAVVSYTPSASAGGGGGGFLLPGGAGRVVSNNHPDPGIPAGTSVAATATTLTLVATAAPMVANRYVGRTLTVAAGVGAGQVRTVTANTATVITVDAAWTVPPTSSTFTIPDAAAPRIDAMGPVAAGGTALGLLPIPVGSVSSSHFLVGGSGGGGAGSQACMTIQVASSRLWSYGAGGGGGGGALALRAGNSLRIGAAASILANGGSTGSITSTAALGASPAPGGAGSGGSIVLQTGNEIDVGGFLDVRGGLGGVFQRSTNGSPTSPIQNNAVVTIQGGNGSPGFIRCEVPGGGPVSLLNNCQPPATVDNVGALAETDEQVMTKSRFYSTGLVFGPEYVRYEIHAVVDGLPVVFSDDPAVATGGEAAGPSSLVNAFFQAATIDLATQEPIVILPWRSRVLSSGSEPGLSSDGLNGFRFLILVRQRTATITLDKVVVVYRV